MNIDYSCSCDIDEAADVYVTKVKKARVQHRCEECFNAILPGEQYHEARMLYDGSWERYTTCCRCMALEAWVKAHIPCFNQCRMHGRLLDDVHSTLEDVLLKNDVPGLKFGALRRYHAIKNGPTFTRNP